MAAFGENLVAAIDDARLAHGGVQTFASPRRLAVLVAELGARQEDRHVEQKGPPVKVAFADDGTPRPAAEAFARKCGVAVAQLSRNKSDKGEWLSFESTEKGHTVAELLPALIERVLRALPHPTPHAMGHERRRVRAAHTLGGFVAWAQGPQRDHNGNQNRQ